MKKMVAPVIITVILSLVLISYMVGCFCLPLIPLPVKLAGAIIFAALLGVSIYVLVERIREIRSGDEDDLSQY